jgi:hypothetical protein
MPTPRLRQVEFIGDSAMVGFGNRSKTRECSQGEVQATTDSQNAFPVLLGKHYGADYQVNALSGAGLIRNYAGHLPDRTLSKIYPYMFFDRTVPYDNPSWAPQLIIIKLQADLVGELNPGERWSSTSALALEYASSYGSFIRELHSRNPKANFLVWWFDREAITHVASTLLLDRMERRLRSTAGSASHRLSLLPMRIPGLELNACAGHHSLSDHRKITDYLIRHIDRIQSLWPAH